MNVINFVRYNVKSNGDNDKKRGKATTENNNNKN
jgi:hypothetical protein